MRGGEIGRGTIEHQQIGGCADGEAERRLACRLRAALKNGLDHGPPGRCAGARHQAVPAPIAQALAIFEKPQFLRHAGRDMAVGADGDRAALRQELRGGKDAIAEIGLGRRAEASDRPGSG